MRPTEQITLIGSIVAATALIKARFVSYADGVPAAGAACKGVSGDNVKAGESVSVKARGWIVVESGAAVAVGAEIETDNLGRAITRNAGVSLGRALDAATAAGQFIRIDR